MGELMRPAPRRSLVQHVVAVARWIGIGRIIAVVASIVAVAAGSFWLLRAPGAADSGRAAPTESSEVIAPTVPGGAAPPDVATTTSVPPSTVPPPVVVHVAGAVVAPGVRQLPAGARVGDAVAAAGGAAPDAVLDAVNLAAPLTDGQQVYVPHAGEASGPAVAVPSASGSSQADAAPLDLNAATEEQFLDLPGIGPVTAAAIVRHREEAGPFTSVDQLLDVPGIGPARLASLDGLVRV